MSHIQKEASIISKLKLQPKNIKQIKRVVDKASKNTASRQNMSRTILRPKDSKELKLILEGVSKNTKNLDVNKAMKDLTSGDKGLVHGVAGWALNKMPKPIKKINKGIDKAYDSYRSRALNFDIKAGKGISDKLKNTRAKDMFINKKKIEIGNTSFGKTYQEFDIPSLTAPLNKAKKAILPTVGAMTLASGLEKFKSTSKEGGDEVVKKAFNREDIIEKIAGSVCSESKKTKHDERDLLKIEDLQKFSKIASDASSMLKSSISKVKDLEESNEKLARENKILELSLIAKNRSDRATKLAYEMNEKGIVKKADINEKIDEIMDMNDDSYNFLADTIAGIKKEAKEEGLDSLTFISKEDTIKERKTLADSINELAR